jgi:hypothetical protein
MNAAAPKGVFLCGGFSDRTIIKISLSRSAKKRGPGAGEDHKQNYRNLYYPDEITRMKLWRTKKKD